MAVKLISVKCPECDAVLDIEEGRQQAFCSYCGAKVIIHNENEHIVRHIDEAGIKREENDLMIRMKQMELLEKKAVLNEKKRAEKVKYSVILGVIGLVMMVVGYLAGSATENPDSGFYMIALVGMFPLMGAVYIWILNKRDDGDDLDFSDKSRIPNQIVDYEKMNYSAVQTLLEGAGFTNVRCVALNDLTVGLFKKPGQVESITINGKDTWAVGKKYSKDSSIVITYHSK